MKSILIMLLLCYLSTASAQFKPTPVIPEVGKRLPDFTLTDVHNYKKKQVTLEDFKGKWLILDFWSLFCTGCIQSMPKYDKMQKELKDDLQIIFVGISHEGRGKSKAENYKLTEAKYNMIKKTNNLDLVVAYDTVVHEQFSSHLLPYLLIVDPNGILRVTTTGISKDDMRQLMKGGKPNLVPYPYETAPQTTRDISEISGYDKSQPLLNSGNGEQFSAVLQRSLITEFSDKFRVGHDNKYSRDSSFELIGETLNMLYSYAYFGRPVPGIPGTGRGVDGGSTRVVLKVRDSSLFTIYNKTKRLDQLKHFSYSLISPRLKGMRFENNPAAQKIMQQDLENYFGFKVQKEIRKVPYLKLIADETAKDKLRTKGGETKVEPVDAYKDFGIIARNFPISKILYYINYTSHSIGKADHFVIDETGINGNIDIRLDAFLNVDYEGLKKELAKNGLHIVLAEKDMECLVIRDRVPEDKTALEK